MSALINYSMRILLISALTALSFSTLSQSTLRGFVYDKSTGEPLIGAQVYLVEPAVGDVSDINCFYQIEGIPLGTYQMEVSYAGYEKFLSVLEVNSEIVSENIFLKEAVEHLDIKPMPTIVMGEAAVAATAARATTPIAHSNVSAASMSKLNIGQDLPYMLRFSPSMVVTSDAGTGIGYTGMRIRGSDASRINVTINGIPLNDAESQGVFWVNLPDFGSSVDNVQIQRGVGTSTNGSGAFGGSVKLQTTNIPTIAGGKVSTSIGSFGTLKNAVEVSSGLLNNRFAFEGRLSRIVSNGYIDRASAHLRSFYLSGGYFGDRTSFKLLVFGGHERTYQSWFGTPESRIDGDEEAMLAHAANNELSDAQTANLLNSGRTYNFYEYENEVDDYGQDHYQAHLNHRFTEELSMNLSGHYTFGRGFFEQFKEGEDVNDYGIIGTGVVNPDLVRRRWLENDFYGGTGSIQWNTGSFKTTIGGGYHQYIGNHFGQLIWVESVQGIAPGHLYYLNQGDKTDGNAYVKTTCEVTESLLAFVDLQYRSVNYSTEGLDSDRRQIAIDDQMNFFNPKAGLYYKMSPNEQLYASYAIGNREPTRNDYIDAPVGTTPTHETLQDVEFGYKHFSNRHRAQVNVYYMQYDNQLVLTGELNDVGTPIRQNAESSFRRGVELEWGWNVYRRINWQGNLTLSQNKIQQFDETVYDYTDGYDVVVNEFSDTDISFSPNATAASVFTFNVIESGPNKMEFSWMTKYVGKQFLDNTSNDDRAINSYLVNDARLLFTHSGHGFKDIRLNLTVNNVLNEMYSSNGYTYGYIYGDRITENFYYPQAGINFLVGLDLVF